MDLRLRNKVVVITGGAGDVGAALSKAFLREEAFVIALDKDAEKGRSLEKQLSGKMGRFHFIKTDVCKPKNVNNAFRLILREFKVIDILVNNAGIFSSSLLLGIKPNFWDKVMQTNLRSALLCVQKALPVMKRKRCGKIINISSVAGQTGGIFAGAHYSASKAGMTSLTKTLARNFGKFGINVNCVTPGPLATSMTKNWPKKVKSALKEKMLIGQKRLGRPEEVADTVLFLSSDRSSFIQGAQIDVNGGLFIR